MASASSLSLVGSVLGRRWRLSQKLGEGSVGEVYAAEPVTGGAAVAVKVLRPAFAADAAVAARFVEEGRRRMRLVHPNIARVVECEPAGEGPPFLVTELLEGVPLGAYTRNGGRVPVAQALSIAQGMLAGLAAAHAQGFVHGDLKPDNVFLVRQAGGTFVVKVLDFGMAEVLDAAATMSSRSREGGFVGTVAYMAPEQTMPGAGPEEVDARADVFSAGAILYEMLTGRVAFSAPTEYARLAAVRSAYPEPMERVDPGLASLGPLVMRALQKAREDRFPSALDMARALAAASALEPASPRAGSPSHPAPSPSLQGSLVSRTLATPSVLAVSSHVASVYAQTSPAPAIDDPPPRIKPSGTLASPADPRGVPEPTPQVQLIGIDGTLPSKDLPVIVNMRPGHGVPLARVIAFVVATLVVGFVLGWLTARR